MPNLGLVRSSEKVWVQRRDAARDDGMDVDILVKSSGTEAADKFACTCCNFGNVAQRRPKDMEQHVH